MGSAPRYQPLGARDESNPTAATAVDAAEIAALVRLAYQPWARRIGREPLPMLANYPALIAAGHTHVLRQGNLIAAVLVLEPRPDDLLVENLAVHPEWQGRGLGRRMMLFAEREGRRLGRTLLRLYTNVAMVENIAFYLRLGYIETHRSIEAGRHRVFMEKRLSG